MVIRPSVSLAYLMITMNILSSLADIGCLYGWQLNEDENKCFINCTSKSNIYCKLLVLQNIPFNYDASTKVLSMARGKSLVASQSLLPSCYNITIRDGQNSNTSGGQLDIGPEVSNYQYLNATSGMVVSMCYPLSPQLLQCDTELLYEGEYVVDGYTLFIPDKNVSVSLGDFYLAENDTATVCSETINVKVNDFYKLPRCNYIALTPDQYEVIGNDSIVIYHLNYTFKNPVYSVIVGKIIYVCIPLAIEFLNCPYKTTSDSFYYTIGDDYSIWNFYYKEFQPNAYYITLDRQMTLCSNATPRISEILEVTYKYICLVSAASLVFTAFYKINFFLQNYHCKCLLCHIISLTLVYLSDGLNNHYSFDEDETTCYVLFAVNHFYVMAALVWLDVVSYDSWRTISRMQTLPPHRCYQRRCRCSCVRLASNSPQRFLIYNLVAWGSSLILTVIPVVLDVVPSPYDFRIPFRPYAIPECSISNHEAFLVLYQLPTTVFKLVTILYLILIVRAMWRARAGTELVNIRRRQQIIRISVKMFIMMSLVWTITGICNFFLTYFTTSFQIWYITTALYSIQGIVIFLIYCTKNIALTFTCIKCRNSR